MPLLSIVIIGASTATNDKQPTFNSLCGYVAHKNVNNNVMCNLLYAFRAIWNSQS